jgi:hypothetical protein
VRLHRLRGLQHIGFAVCNTQVVPGSGLPVLNCCGAGRLPAYDPNAAALAEYGGHNVLCANCLEHHSLVNGRCVYCPAIEAGRLLGMVLLLLLLVFTVHRLPRDYQGSGAPAIFAYFIQQSNLFLSAESIPQAVALLNVNLLGEHVTRGAGPSGMSALNLDLSACIVPLSDYGRMGVLLLSPVVAVALLGVILVLQLALLCCTRHTSRTDRYPALARFLLCLDEALFPTSLPSPKPRGEEDAVDAEVNASGLRHFLLPYQSSLMRLCQLS